MDLFPIYVLNLIVIICMLITTLYRAWMEKQNLKARRTIEKLNVILIKEAELIKELSGEEFVDMLKTILEK